MVNNGMCNNRVIVRIIIQCKRAWLLLCDSKIVSNIIRTFCRVVFTDMEDLTMRPHWIANVLQLNTPMRFAARNLYLLPYKKTGSKYLLPVSFEAWYTHTHTHTHTHTYIYIYIYIHIITRIQTLCFIHSLITNYLFCFSQMFEIYDAEKIEIK